MRIAVIANQIDPNRVALFEQVQSMGGIEFLVVYETAMEANRQWRVSGNLRTPTFSSDRSRSTCTEPTRISTYRSGHSNPFCRSGPMWWWAQEEASGARRPTSSLS